MTLSTSEVLKVRMQRWGPELHQSLRAIYGDEAPIAEVGKIIAQTMIERPKELQLLDEARQLHPDWLQEPEQVGYVTYADRFAGNLAGVATHLDHLEDLGVTYLHLMPLLEPRPGDSDGGYAVMDYRKVNPALGSMADLAQLASELHSKDISLVVDLVLNHVAQEHEWAARARGGEQQYQDYFHLFDDRELPDAYERTLPEVFPDFAPGNFTFSPELDSWVWTTFNEFQWDVNWANPDVFCEYLSIICHLANQGVDIFRLDAIAFIWKRLGTTCQNEPEVHTLARALRTATRIAAPAVAFKAEAIVGPRDLIAYFGTGQHYGKLSDLAYHNSLMAQLWSSLASRDVTLLAHALESFPPKPMSATWASYVRCHDDIGWAVDDRDAAEIGISGYEHRRFLSDFYAGEFPGSFARGLVFQANPHTGDRRISGTLASLAGLESALESEDQLAIDLAVRRINLLHAVILGFGGVPLIYMGDEIGMLNDYNYVNNPDHAEDNRWVHRPRMNWDAVALLKAAPQSPQARVNAWLKHLIGVRKQTRQLGAGREAEFLHSDHPSVLTVKREHPVGSMVQLYNFSPQPVTIQMNLVQRELGPTGREIIDDQNWDLTTALLRLEPYQVRWLIAEPE